MQELTKSILIVSLFLCSYLFYHFKIPLRNLLLFINFIFFGMYLGYFVSIVHIYYLLKLNFSILMSSISFFIFLLLAFFSHLFWGRFFCGWICPFGIISWYLKKIRDFFKMSLSFLQGRFIFLFYFKILFLAIGIFLISKGNYSMVELEPFFKYSKFPPSFLKKVWFFILLILNFFIPYFWCRYLCFTGAFFKILSYFSLTKYIFKCKNKDCKICIQKCPKGIITLEKNIIQSECIRCLECHKCELSQK